MMNSEHRNIIKNIRDQLSEKIVLDKLKPYLKEYKIFNRYMLNDIKSVSDVFDALPTRGPKAFENIIEILRKAGYNDEAYILQNPQRQIRNKDLYYKMTSRPVGYCLIINNVVFDSPVDEPGKKIRKPLETRYGSDVDAKSLQDFFESVDFVVSVEKDLKAEEMLQRIKKFSEENFAIVDSMILIILSHGGQENNKDYVSGTDGKFIYKSAICDVFSDKNCEYLQNKPKIFIFVACRGDGADYGVPELNYMPHPKTIPSESVDSVSYVMSEFTDMHIIHSTLPSLFSVRNHETGSYFCETLVSVLKEYHQIYDLRTMIALVNGKLKNKVSLVYCTVQVAHYEDMGGTKNIMF